MNTTYQVSANGTTFGTYETDSEQAARDLCAQDAGYKSEADMVERLGQPSELVAEAVPPRDHTMNTTTTEAPVISTASAVNALLDKHGVRFIVSYMGEKKRALGGTAAMDKWSCELTGHARPMEPEAFAYFTGLGHRKVVPWGPTTPGYDGGPAPRHGSQLHTSWMKTAKPTEPSAADVLHSLILDSTASEQSFDSWCEEFGLDSDSRKALATYEECQKNTDKLRKVIPAHVLLQLRDLLQDY